MHKPGSERWRVFTICIPVADLRVRHDHATDADRDAAERTISRRASLVCARSAGAAHPSAEQTAQLAAWRAKIPDAAYWDYVGARARDVDTDAALITLAAQGDINWLAITQDDAGAPDGLQIADQRRARRIWSRSCMPMTACY